LRLLAETKEPRHLSAAGFLVNQWVASVRDHDPSSPIATVFMSSLGSTAAQNRSSRDKQRFLPACSEAGSAGGSRRGRPGDEKEGKAVGLRTRARRETDPEDRTRDLMARQAGDGGQNLVRINRAGPDLLKWDAAGGLAGDGHGRPG
jgi:hypothetical protein